MIGLVTKKQSTLFEVVVDEKKFQCNARGNVKSRGINVGDNVEFNEDSLVISNVQARKNILIRPPMANLDKMFIVVCPKPKPDFYLVDKLILFCSINNIKPIICANKVDLDENFEREIKENYEKYFEIVFCSAKLNMTKSLEEKIEGVCAFAGQSAVGKSSLINSIFKSNIEKVGDFGKKVERGKQTTRVVTLYKMPKGFIADTAGFSQLDESLIDIDYRELSRYYPDFYPYINECKYQTCDHTNDKDCKLIQAVKDGKVSRNRYENYLKLLSRKKSERRY